MQQMVEVNVVGLIVDPVSKSPVMILKPVDERKVIPIWIGMNEANAIAMELENVCSPRPMTHDLIHSLMDELQVTVEKVIISDIVENTFYAQLYLHCLGGEKILDCRPSDGVAVALKNHAKIFVSPQILETSLIADLFSNLVDGEERINQWFQSLQPDDFGGVEQ